MSTTLFPISVAELASWLAEQTWSQFAVSVARQFERNGRISEAQEASARSMYAKAQARQAQRQVQAPVNPVTEVGMYLNAEGVAFRVKMSKSTGRLYAERFVPEAEARADRFVYEGGAVYRLDASMRMTLEQAKALGAQYAQCCVCGRNLTADQSVEAGIGPICAGRL
jgi:hypothetical protein